MRGETGTYDISHFPNPYRRHLRWIEDETDTPIAALGTGPRNNERIKVMELVKRR